MLVGPSNSTAGNHHNTVAFGKAARVFGCICGFTTVETKSPAAGNVAASCEPYFQGRNPSRFFHELWTTKKLCRRRSKKAYARRFSLPALRRKPVLRCDVQALHDGYESTFVGGLRGRCGQLAHDNAMKRVIQAGAKAVTSLRLSRMASAIGPTRT